MNVVTLIGNLATDVDLRALDGGKHLATFLLAVDRPGREGADFVRVAVWDRQAEACARFLAKGKQIALDGRLRSRSWEEDGKRRSAVEVVAHTVQFLSPNGDGAPAPRFPSRPPRPSALHSARGGAARRDPRLRSGAARPRVLLATTGRRECRSRAPSR